ncbi:MULTISPECIES: DUF1304 domain-containing protein [unclassified Microcella]|uniref:DUF1304 domain-containing protein n=1 Tax=unclassified Microcella TaxID=2630066 RepID=UPI0006F9347D|nr:MULTISPECIES: DUF1304 domain-containing protein [unclassified Microcella]KQV25969.1 hypothetical protein ASC54_03185 [Yonghaparkia sp. Root332]KRF33224.1 hypothetical protein ASG83_04460 [Yonghaparkia sp. Soil809]
MTPFSAIGLIAAVLAAALHIGFFVLESLAFSRPRVRRMFGVRVEDDSRPLRLFAANQGVYNLALAAAAVVGVGTAWNGDLALGVGIAASALAVMVVAALALAISAPRLWAGAVIQGAPAAVGLAGILTLLPA